MFGGIPAFGGHSLSGSIERSATLTAKDSRLDIESETFFVAPTLDASFGRLQGCSGQDANHGHGHLVVHGTQDPDINIELAHPLGRNSGQENALMAFTQNSRSEVRHIGGHGQIVGALAAEAGAQQQNYLAYSTKLHHTSACGAGKLYEEYTASLDACSPPPALLIPSQVRRLTPRECERLQGMPDDYTLIPWRGKPADECPDGPRYKAIGNSKAVTVVRWIGQRILRQLKTSPYG
jgi:DNA (cytosine-5)-methyltransferase 1